MPGGPIVGLLPSAGLVFDINDLYRVGPEFAQSRVDVLLAWQGSNLRVPD